MSMSPLEVVAKYPEHFDKKFVKLLPAMLPIYRAIEREALKKAMRRNFYAIDNIVADMRWDTAISEPGEWKFNNNHRAYYARLFHFMHPNHRIFRMRITKSEQDAGVFPPV